MSSHPPRVAHLLSVSLLAELLAPSYASANDRTAAEVYDEVKTGLDGAGLHGPLCAAIWSALKNAQGERDEAGLVECLAKALARKGGPKAKEATQSLEDQMAPVFAAIDLHIGRAGEAARRALQTSAGRQALSKALAAAATHLLRAIKV